MMFGPEDPMLISEIFNNTTKMGLQVQFKKMKFEVKQPDSSTFSQNLDLMLASGNFGVPQKQEQE